MRMVDSHGPQGAQKVCPKTANTNPRVLEGARKLGLVWSALVWSGLLWSGLVWSGLVWSGLVWWWSGLVWSGLAWYGRIWSQAKILKRRSQEIEDKTNPS